MGQVVAAFTESVVDETYRKQRPGSATIDGA